MTTAKIILEELKKGSKTVKELYEVLKPIDELREFLKEGNKTRLMINRKFPTRTIRDIGSSLAYLDRKKELTITVRRRIEGGNLYTYKSENNKVEKSNLQKLTDLQKELGYKKGDIDPIAILGIAGESGEILNELEFGVIKTAFPNTVLMEINGFVRTAERIDTIKKEVRNKDLDIICNIKSTEEFDLEISDLFYYLNAVCINRNKSIEEYAKLSFDKVTEKIKTKKVR